MEFRKFQIIVNVVGLTAGIITILSNTSLSVDNSIIGKIPEVILALLLILMAVLSFKK